MKNRIVYLDMDGCISDFDGAFENLFGFKTSQTEDNVIWSKIEGYGKTRFFAEMPWTIDGKELWDYVYNNFLEVKILTALGKTDAIDGGKGSKGKRLWLLKNIPILQDSDIIMVSNKHKKRHYSKPDDIIIDDREIVVQEWNKKGGIGILHKTAADTINKLKQYVYEEI